MKWIATMLAVLSALPVLAQTCPPHSDALALLPATPAQFPGYARIAPIPLSRPFDIELIFCGEGADAIQRIDVDAVMPAHQHGMNYRPHVDALGQGRFRVSGMVFHMPGQWRVQVMVFGDGAPVFYTLEVAAR